MKEYETPSVETYGTVEEKTNWWDHDDGYGKWD
jgi:hypothetical protein